MDLVLVIHFVWKLRCHLYGHEMDDEVSPLETGLNFGVKMRKDEFIGKKAIEDRGTPKIERIGLKVTGRGIIREHQDLYAGDQKIGHTTSGTHCPYLGYPIAMALVDAGSVAIGDKVEADVRGRRVEAEVVHFRSIREQKIKENNNENRLTVRSQKKSDRECLEKATGS